MKKVFVAMDIGCMEFGEDSTCLGIFDTIDEAQKMFNEFDKKHQGKRHSFETFEVEIKS